MCADKVKYNKSTERQGDPVSLYKKIIYRKERLYECIGYFKYGLGMLFRLKNTHITVYYIYVYLYILFIYVFYIYIYYSVNSLNLKITVLYSIIFGQFICGFWIRIVTKLSNSNVSQFLNNIYSGKDSLSIGLSIYQEFIMEN